MIWIRYLISLLTIVIVFVFPASNSADISTGQAALTQALTDLPGRIKAAISEDRLVSVSMAIVLDQDIIFCKAFGYADLKQQRLATPNTIYPMGSITKVFTATMLARQWGNLAIDSVRRY